MIIKTKFNHQALIKRIEKSCTKEDLAAKIGMSRASLYNKLSGKSYFSQAEILRISDVLEIKPEKFCLYFLDKGEILDEQQ